MKVRDFLKVFSPEESKGGFIHFCFYDSDEDYDADRFNYRRSKAYRVDDEYISEAAQGLSGNAIIKQIYAWHDDLYIKAVIGGAA